jgi:hypothetical protein
MVKRVGRVDGVDGVDGLGRVGGVPEIQKDFNSNQKPFSFLTFLGKGEKGKLTHPLCGCWWSTSPSQGMLWWARLIRTLTV